MRKVVVTILLIIVIISDILLIKFLDSKQVLLEDIKIINYNRETNIISLEVKRNKVSENLSDFECIISSKDNSRSIPGKNYKCTIDISLDRDYEIYLKNNYSESSSTNIIEFLKKHVDKFSFKTSSIYLAVNEKTNIETNNEYPAELLYDFKIEDDNIVTLDNGYLVGKSSGKTTITEKNSNEKIDIIVTDLITNYVLPENKKEIIPCNEYSEEEANLLDEYLAYKINKAGYNTRAGVVEAGRFLTLQFKYRIPYFYENGRLSDTGTHITDGEGRFYHEGLYLANSKKKSITKKHKGPAIWGCPLTNLNPDEKHGYFVGKKKPNGLDCSGFVTWAFRNGGTDPGDIGAGETPDKYQMTDTGEFTKLTEEIIAKDNIRAGDLFNFWGHIALIIGVDNDNYYVAESLPYLGGVVVRTYKKSKVMKTFTHVVYMDKFYTNGDGNYTAMWK